MRVSQRQLTLLILHTENISYLAITKEHQKQKGSETGKSRKINIYFYFMAEMKVLQPEGDGY